MGGRALRQADKSGRRRTGLLGHDAGDELLIQMSARLSKAVRATDTVVRLGGDEFVIVLFDQPEAEDSVGGALNRLMKAVAEPLDLRGHRVQLGCSIGLASYPLDGRDGNTLLKNADAAMYRAKELGKNTFEHFTADMRLKAQERLILQDGLLKAMAREALCFQYQPQIDLATQPVIGVETLIRWRHLNLGVVPPTTFIPLAEDNGMIVSLGLWVLRTACRQQVAWQRSGRPAIKLSVNVSPRQCKAPHFADTVAAVLEETGIDQNLPGLEITESHTMEDVARALAMMNRTRALGVQLFIDDSGTRTYGLSSLKNFPVSRPKIDSSFVNMPPGDTDDCILAKAVIALGHPLNLKVVAEGVETQGQQDFLRASPCDEMQGFHFSRPVSPAEVASMLKRGANAEAR